MPKASGSRWHRRSSLDLRLRDPNACRAPAATLYVFALALADRLERRAHRSVVDVVWRMALGDDLRIIKVAVVPAWTARRPFDWRAVV
eukprot:8083166-Alexandrium_andersonii.AAC.1